MLLILFILNGTGHSLDLGNYFYLSSFVKKILMTIILFVIPLIFLIFSQEKYFSKLAFTYVLLMQVVFAMVSTTNLVLLYMFEVIISILLVSMSNSAKEPFQTKKTLLSYLKPDLLLFVILFLCGTKSFNLINFTISHTVIFFSSVLILFLIIIKDFFITPLFNENFKCSWFELLVKVIVNPIRIIVYIMLSQNLLSSLPSVKALEILDIFPFVFGLMVFVFILIGFKKVKIEPLSKVIFIIPYLYLLTLGVLEKDDEVLYSAFLYLLIYSTSLALLKMLFLIVSTRNNTYTTFNLARLTLLLFFVILIGLPPFVTYDLKIAIMDMLNSSGFVLNIILIEVIFAIYAYKLVNIYVSNNFSNMVQKVPSISQGIIYSFYGIMILISKTFLN